MVDIILVRGTAGLPSFPNLPSGGLRTPVPARSGSVPGGLPDPLDRRFRQGPHTEVGVVVAEVFDSWEQLAGLGAEGTHRHDDRGQELDVRRAVIQETSGSR